MPTKDAKFVIAPPKMESATVTIVGTSQLVVHRFSEKTRRMLEAQMMEGSRAKNKKTRDPRDFEDDYLRALYVAEEGWYGVPAPSFRNAFISACRVAGFPMTRAKLSIFVAADGYDREDKKPLVRITKGEPTPWQTIVRNESGVIDIRNRPRWEKGWEMVLRVSWDAEQFSATDVFNLIARAGLQVGVGEGRPDSPNSNGLGFGCWELGEESIVEIGVTPPPRKRAA